MKSQKLLLATIIALFSLVFFVSWRNKEKPRPVIRVVEPTITMCGSFFRTFQDTVFLPVQLLSGLGDLHYSITTKNPLAQNFFDQGLRLIYAFNHVEALRSFQEASRLDPGCAMTYWGQALALGPNINDINPKDREQMAFEAISKAKKIVTSSSPREIGFINALASRYNGKAYDIRDSLNTSYREAMDALAKKFPDDPEIQTLYADAIMNCIPWDYWNRDGSPKPFTRDAKSALESVIKKFPNHPGAHHMYIHLVEASPDPGQGLKSAGFLENAMPKAGHLVHMPSHIYVRVGNYEKANFSNSSAIKVDEEFLSESNDQGMYRVGYYPHNIDFLSFGSYMNGQSAVAVQSANKLVNQIAVLERKMPTLYDFFLPQPLITHIRFGGWNEILTLPLPDEKYLNSTTMARFARGLAFLRKGRVYEAKVEFNKLDSLNRLDTLKTLYASFNSAGQLSNMAVHILKGELLMKQNKVEEALKALNSAVLAEDTMRYTEPPDWRLPARHFLGGAMLDAGRYADAEKVFLEDLKKNPENGWALLGLMQCQAKLGKSKEASATAHRFEKAWKNADVKISSSRF